MEGWCYQIGWIFGKIPNGHGPPSLILENYVAISFRKTLVKRPYVKVQHLRYKFWDWKWPPPLLVFFRKFIRFGSATLPWMPYLIFVNFGTPLHYLGLKKYTKKCVNLGQNKPNWPKWAFSMLKSTPAWNKYTIAGVSALTNMSYSQCSSIFENEQSLWGLQTGRWQKLRLYGKSRIFRPKTEISGPKKPTS